MAVLLFGHVIADMQMSALCDERQYEHLDSDALAKLYDDPIAGLLDKQIPVRQVTCRRRPSTMWFDYECRRAKRVLRSVERAARRTGPLSDNNLLAVAAWRVQRRQYFTLLQQKRSDLWTKGLDAEQSRPRRLLRSFDELFGGGRAPLSSDIDASTLHRFFDDKVAGVHPLLALIHRPSRPFLSVVNSGCSRRSHQLT